MGLSQPWMSQKHSRRFRRGKGRRVIKPHSQEALQTENKGQGKEKERNLGRKQDKEVGNQASAVAGRVSRMLFTRLPRSSSYRSSERRGSLCPVCKAEERQKACGQLALGGLEPSGQCLVSQRNGSVLIYRYLGLAPLSTC